MTSLLTSWLTGRMPKWFLTGVWAPVLSVAVAALFALSAARFPGGYDWRYDVMCRLGYGHVNPDGRAFWSWALILVCVMGLPCANYFHARLAGIARRQASFARAVLALGLTCGIIIGLEGLLLPRLNDLLHKLHETVATVTFAGIFFGVLAFWSIMTKWLRRKRGWSAAACTLLSLLVLVPMAGAMISQAWLFFVPNDLGWVGPDWAERGVPVYLSFAFWEWTAIAGIYACLYVMAALLPAAPDEDEA